MTCAWSSIWPIASQCSTREASSPKARQMRSLPARPYRPPIWVTQHERRAEPLQASSHSLGGQRGHEVPNVGAQMNAALTAAGLHTYYGKSHILNGVSLEVAEG